MADTSVNSDGLSNTGHLINAVQVVALVSTIGFFIAGSVTCYKIHRQKSVKNVNFLPFLLTALNCFLWFMYGVLKEDKLLCVVNGTGCAFQILYIFVFVQNCDKKQIYIKKILIVIGMAILIGLMARFGKENFDVVAILGWIASTVTVFMFGSPLSTIRIVIQTKNSETISLPLSIMTVLVSGSWFLYGYLIADAFVQVPNCLGVLLGLSQLYLYNQYSQNTPSIPI